MFKLHLGLIFCLPWLYVLRYSYFSFPSVISSIQRGRSIRDRAIFLWFAFGKARHVTERIRNNLQEKTTLYLIFWRSTFPCNFHLLLTGMCSETFLIDTRKRDSTHYTPAPADTSCAPSQSYYLLLINTEISSIYSSLHDACFLSLHVITFSSLPTVQWFIFSIFVMGMFLNHIVGWTWFFNCTLLSKKSGELLFMTLLYLWKALHPINIFFQIFAGKVVPIICPRYVYSFTFMYFVPDDYYFVLPTES